MKFPRFILRTIFFILLFVEIGYAQGIEYLGSTLWSGVCDVKVQGNYAYCAFFNGLMILDIANPDTPSFVSQYYIGGDLNEYERRSGQRLFVSGNYIYFTADYLGLQIIDITNPANPALASEYHTHTDASGIFVQDTLAYVVCVFDHLHGIYSSLEILDISNPVNPVLVGNCDITSDARGIWIEGNYAYVADDLSGLQVIDISDPSHPTIIGNIMLGSYAVDVEVVGNYAYVAYGYAGLVILDISDPHNPVFVSNITYYDFWFDGLSIRDNYAYLGTDGKFLVVDITDPAHPSISGLISGDWYFGIAISGNYAYLSSLQTGLIVIDISNPTNPVFAGAFDKARTVRDVDIVGDYAYAACLDKGLDILSVADPTHPIVIGNWSYYNPIYGEYETINLITISGNYAYCYNPWRGLQIIDISNPQIPISMGSYMPPRDIIKAIFVSYPYAYLASYDDGLYIIYISDPMHPSFIGRYGTSSHAWDVYVQGNYAYVAATFSFLILNIADPSNPILAGSYAGYNNEYSGVSVMGDYAYCIGSRHGANGGGLVLDVSDPANIVEVSGFGSEGIPMDITVLGNNMYIAEGFTTVDWKGLQILDITNPASPTLADEFRTPSYGYGVAVSENKVYLADYNSFMIFQFNPTGIGNDAPIANSFFLSQNYPNPFNASTTINYSLPKFSDVSIDIFDILGRKVETLVSEEQPAGEHSIVWNAKDFSSGIYFAKLHSNEQTKNIKMVLLK